MANNKETQRTRGEARLPSRRNILTGGALFCALTAASVDGTRRFRHIQNANKELELLRSKLSETELEADRKLIAQYDSCQKITNGECNEIISNEKLTQIKKAKTAIRQDELYKNKVEERTNLDIVRLMLVDIVGGSFSILSIFSVRAIVDAFDIYKGRV